MHVVRIAGLVSPSDAVNIQNISSVMKVRAWIQHVSNGDNAPGLSGPAN